MRLCLATFPSVEVIIQELQECFPQLPALGSDFQSERWQKWKLWSSLHAMHALHSSAGCLSNVPWRASPTWPLVHCIHPHVKHRQNEHGFGVDGLLAFMCVSSAWAGLPLVTLSRLSWCWTQTFVLACALSKLNCPLRNVATTCINDLWNEFQSPHPPSEVEKWQNSWSLLRGH